MTCLAVYTLVHAIEDLFVSTSHPPNTIVASRYLANQQSDANVT